MINAMTPNRRRQGLTIALTAVLTAVITILTTLYVVKYGQLFTTTKVSHQSPLESYRNADGYLDKYPGFDADRYEGFNQYELGGEQIGNDPLRYVDEAVTQRDDSSYPNKITVSSDDLIAGLSNASPLVTDYSELDGKSRKQSLEQRAIAHMRYQIGRHGEINILPGTVAALPLDDYGQRVKGQYLDEEGAALVQYRQPMLYLERNGAKVSSVLVIVDQAYDDKQVGKFSTDWTGVSYTEEAHRGKFVMADSPYREWTARAFDGDCKPEVPSSNCVYKFGQQVKTTSGVADKRFNGHEQVVLVGEITTYGFDYEADSGNGTRHIDEGFAFTFDEHLALPLGSWYSSDSDDMDHTTATQKVKALLGDGGTAFGSLQLSTMTAYGTLE